MSATSWKIKVGVDLDTSDIQKQLDNATKGVSLPLGKKGAVKDVGLEYQQYMMILRTAVRVVTNMAEETIKLDSAQTQFRKVSELSGKALDDYTKKLTQMGKQVGRSG